MVELYNAGEYTNPQGLAYLNRLSSLCFVFEINEIRAGRVGPPTLAKRKSI
jgi:cob(I)alamin adenosyltransferase